MIGKGNKSFRKLDIQEKSVGTGFVAIKFAHKASGGESTMNLASLTVPTEMTSNGFTNPSASQLLGAKLMFYRNNLKLRSSLRGELSDYLAYVVESNSLIRFLGFTLEQNEIIEGSLGNTPRDGLLVVDGEPVATTGILALSATDFNVSIPFEINKFPTQQIGAVKVYREGLLQARCEGNVLTGDGNYIEVPVSGGLGTLIRFKDAGEPSNIIVTSNGSLIERPQDSLMAATERLGGQIDAIVAGLSEVTGNDPTTYQAAPNNVDLKQFGDRVLANESRITALENANKLRVRAHRNGVDQTGINPNNSSVGLIFNSVSTSFTGFDTLSGAHYNAATGILTNNSSVTKYYRAGCTIQIAATNVLANAYSLVGIKNGSTYLGDFAQRDRLDAAVAGVAWMIGGTIMFSLNPGETFQPYLFGLGNNSASTLTMVGSITASGSRLEITEE